ncbi:hypothetical protein SAY86_018269 [Trapa natans]|uniref:Uncharacterized protein n=1 Tax=Trapa natans TaxID=22666 RepID=A0AAN7R1J0_TRANT|nr:hypothetical protein SAY86_018269 [Trapa natans]
MEAKVRKSTALGGGDHLPQPEGPEQAGRAKHCNGGEHRGQQEIELRHSHHAFRYAEDLSLDAERDSDEARDRAVNVVGAFLAPFVRVA